MPRTDIYSNTAANPPGLAYKSYSLIIQKLKRLYFCTYANLFFYLNHTISNIRNDITLHNILPIICQIRRNHKIKTNTKYELFDISNFFCVNSNLFRIAHGSNFPKFIGRLSLLSLYMYLEV
jgi:tyrosine-protein phosphatase YwqE